MNGIPPWLIPADPAQWTARGTEIGAQLAAQRAAQAYQQRQQALEAQRLAIGQQEAQQRLALDQADQQMRAQAASAKFAGMQGYTEAVRSGQDPIRAMLEWGPQMGQQASPEAAALRSMMMQKQLADRDAQAEQNRQLRQTLATMAEAGKGERTQETLESQEKRAQQAIDARAKNVQAQIEAGKTRVQINQLGRQEAALQKQLDVDELPGSVYNTFRTKPASKLKPAEAAVIQAHKDRQDRLTAIQSQIDDLTIGPEGGQAPASAARATETTPAQPLMAAPTERAGTSPPSQEPPPLKVLSVRPLTTTATTPPTTAVPPSPRIVVPPGAVPQPLPAQAGRQYNLGAGEYWPGHGYRLAENKKAEIYRMWDDLLPGLWSERKKSDVPLPSAYGSIWQNNPKKDIQVLKGWLDTNPESPHAEKVKTTLIPALQSLAALDSGGQQPVSAFE